MPHKNHNIAVIGDGGWGMTLAIHLIKKGYPVTLWGAFPSYIQQMQRTRKNPKFLPGIRIPKKLSLTSDLKIALQKSDLIVLAVPSQYMGSVLKKIKKLDFSKKIVLSVIKGIDTKSLLRMSQVITQELGHVNLAVLSGPTIAREVVQGIPSTAVIASRDLEVARRLQKIFNSDTFRIYTHSDVIGLELGGSLKNVIAIACGVCDGLGFGTNAKAAILTRGLREMSQLGKEMGAKQKTFFGLAGLGDLVTTCTSPDSRNRYVGEQLGRGRSLRQVIAHMNMVAEGVVTVKAVQRLSRKFKVPMPITSEVYNIIYQGKNPKKAARDLMTRDIKPE